jgi:hypothetical protein
MHFQGQGHTRGYFLAFIFPVGPDSVKIL